MVTKAITHYAGLIIKCLKMKRKITRKFIKAKVELMMTRDLVEQALLDVPASEEQKEKCLGRLPSEQT